MDIKNIFACAALTIAAGTAWAGTPSEAVSAFHAAMVAGDKAKALAALSPAVVIYESGYAERSRDEYASHHLASDIEFSKETTRKVLKHSERVEGNVAAVMEETETSGSFKGKPVHAMGLETTLLEKKNDQWIIVHVHWSSRKVK